VTVKTTLHNASQGHKALSDVWTHIKPILLSGQKLTLTVAEEKRSLDMNAKFHAICSDLQRSKLPWAGKPRDAAAWKVLLVSGHAVATKQGAEMLPGLEGEFVNIRESTALMSKKRGSSLIEYAVAFCASNGVELTETEEETA